MWEPPPPEKVLDALREEFLQWITQAEVLDPGTCHLGIDQARVWMLQELGGASLQRLWDQAGPDGRRDLRARLADALAGARAPRLLVPEVMGIESGRVLAPRVLGPAPLGTEGLFTALEQAAPPPGPDGGDQPWAEPPELGGGRTPLRGRGRELTYLKSLVLALGTALPMERVLILLGEEGLGHGRLCDWAAAVAETERIWVASVELYPGERAGSMLERIVAELIAGLEADLYAARPAAARALARRTSAFAFLRGGRRAGPGEPVTPEEAAAAQEALAFAQSRHPRLVLVRGLERAAPEAPALLRDLVLGSPLPWLISARDPGLGPEAKACLTVLGRNRLTATILLDRLEDGHLRDILGDLLDPHDLPAALLAELCAASLGNPGLLRKTLEAAQVKGAIFRAGGHWAVAPEGPPALEGQADLAAELLMGRIRRLQPVPLAALRYLALADEPLELAFLGRALDLDRDEVEEALHAVTGAKLALADAGAAQVAGLQARDLVLAQMPAREKMRGARALLRVLEREGGRPLLAVRLQSFALDRAPALAKVLEVVEREETGPLEAERILQAALRLEPDLRQRAGLWEFLADAWGRATQADVVTAEGASALSPWEQAAEAVDRALAFLAEAGPTAATEESVARLHRKRGLLDLRLRRTDQAEQALRTASALLADHPFHPEQARLRSAQGRLHLARGSMGRAAAAFRDGLDLLQRRDAGPDHRDQAALLLDLGRAQGESAQFQAALDTLDALTRLTEHGRDRRMRAAALEALGQVRLGLGQADAAAKCMEGAAGLAKSLDDPVLAAECRFSLGAFWSGRQLLGRARACLEDARRGFELIGDRAGAVQVQAWMARNLAALGEPLQADLLLVRTTGAGPGGPEAMPLELAERAFLDGESAGFRDDWSAARRHYLAAANRFENAGLVWRHRLARLRCIQAEALEGAARAEANLRPAWMRLDLLKEPVEASGSRWLELEWQRARALLLGAAADAGPDPAGAPPVETLAAWGEVMAAGRQLRFPAVVLEAGARSSVLLLALGERLGARARIQDAAASFRELWAELPAGGGPAFLGRKDIHAFLEVAERVGLDIPRPPQDDLLPD
jgi:tetratricopeptide (TPR) repeat protein